MDTLNIVGTVFSALQTLELCLKYGKEIVATFKSQLNINKELDEFIESYEGLWVKTQVQLESLRVIWSTLPGPLQEHYANALARLESKESSVWKNLESIANSQGPLNAVHKLKIHTEWTYLRGQIKQAVSELETWQSKFDPSWYLITRIASVTLDTHLQAVAPNASSDRLSRMREAIKKSSQLPDIAESVPPQSVFQDSSEISHELYQITDSSTFVAIHAGRHVLLDRTNYPTSLPMQQVKPYVRDLAKLLRNVDPATFGLLACVGLTEWQDSSSETTQFQFIFDISKTLLPKPTSLRYLLIQELTYPLNQRIQLARQLARSVMFVHTVGFVHKNIRPETIVVFPEENNNSDIKTSIGQSFLAGFERSRPADALTNRLGDLKWERNLYRHPKRQGAWPEELFTMQHDVYSLGVCLLEIGLWCTFVCDDDSPWSGLNITSAISDKDQKRGAYAIKRELIALAKSRLPSLVGERYMNLTIACLTCLDQGDGNTFGTEKELYDQDGILVGVRYIEKILLQMEDISL